MPSPSMRASNSEMRKFGLKVAELIATIRPLTNDDA